MRHCFAKITAKIKKIIKNKICGFSKAPIAKAKILINRYLSPLVFKKIDFLLVIPKDDLGIVDNFMKENKDYSAQQINIEKDNLINIKIQENEF